MEYLEFRLMNSDIVLAAEAPDAEAPDAEGSPEQIQSGFRAARKLMEDYERRFSRFLTDSELARMNRSAGRWFCASPELFDLVRLSRTYFYQTGGLFDPSILPDLKRAGYDRSMEEIRIYGVKQQMMENRGKRPSFEAVRLEENKRKIWLPPGMEIDLGGIAKGWIAEQAARLLWTYTSACAVNAGGDLYLMGIPDGRVDWEVALEDPRYPDQDLAVLRVGSGAVATSSITKRNWKQGNKHQHHLIDPRSGEPAVTDWLSVTVIAPQAATAEVFAKALLIVGSDQAIEFLAKNDEIAFIAVDRQGKLWGSPESMERFNANPGIFQMVV